MGFPGLKGDCLRSTEALPKCYKNSHPRAGNFHVYRILVVFSSFCISFFKIRINGFNIFIDEYIIFFNSIWIYAFIHKNSNDVIHSFIHSFAMSSLTVTSFKMQVILHQGSGCKMIFSCIGENGRKSSLKCNINWYCTPHTNVYI